LQPRWLGALRCACSGLCPTRASQRETEPRTVVEKTLEGENPRRAPTDDLGLARCGVVAERTPGGSKASKRACRLFTASPASAGSGRHVRLTSVCRGDRTQRPRGTHVPAHASRVHLRVGACGKELGAEGESDREDPAGAAPATVGGRTRKEATARESGCGSPGRESSGGALQGRERSPPLGRKSGG